MNLAKPPSYVGTSGNENWINWPTSNMVFWASDSKEEEKAKELHSPSKVGKKASNYEKYLPVKDSQVNSPNYPCISLFYIGIFQTSLFIVFEAAVVLCYLLGDPLNPSFYIPLCLIHRLQQFNQGRLGMQVSTLGNMIIVALSYCIGKMAGLYIQEKISPKLWYDQI